MSPTSIPICLQTREVHRNSNASHDYTYTGSIGKQVSYIWAFLDIEGASCDIKRLPIYMGLEKHSSNGWALLSGRKIRAKLTGEKCWRGLWPSAIHRGALYYPYCVAWLQTKSSRDLIGMDVILCSYALSSAEHSRLLSQSFVSRFWVWNNSGVIEISHQSIHNWFLFEFKGCKKD